MVQVESFHRIRSSYDTVILDESESIYAQFSSSNIKRLNNIISNFQYVISRAKRVICMDAYLGHRTVEVTNYLRGKDKIDIKFTINTFKNQGKKADPNQHRIYI